jgi:hypothetical protein
MVRRALSSCAPNTLQGRTLTQTLPVVPLAVYSIPMSEDVLYKKPPLKIYCLHPDFSYLLARICPLFSILLSFKGAMWTLRTQYVSNLTKFAENLRASPFTKDLSNETTFSLVHLAGQYKYL